MSNETNNYAQSVAEMWSVLLRYKWRFVVPAFLVTIGVLGGTMLLPRKYRAEATFERRSDMVLTEIITRGGAPRAFSNPRQTVNEELTGQTAVLELIRGMTPELIAKFKKNNGQFDPRKLVKELPQRLLVKFDLATNELDRVRLQYICNDPDLAQYVVNTLVQNYINRSKKAMDERLLQSAEFYKSEVSTCRDEIEQLENEKLNFEIKFAQLLPDSPNSATTRLSEAEMELVEIEQMLSLATAKSSSLQQSLDKTPENIPSYTTERNPRLIALEKKHTELEEKKKEYIATYKMTPNHPDLINLQEQIELLSAQIETTEEKVVTQTQVTANPKYAEIELLLNNSLAEKEALENQAAGLKKQIDELVLTTNNLYPVRSEYRRIEQQVEKQQRQLAFWEDNLRRVNISLAAETGDRGISLELISPATNIDAPISPNPKQGLSAAVILGLIVGATCVFFGHRTNESYTDSDQITEDFDLPVMGSVSEIIGRKQRAIRRVRQMVLYPINAAAMIAILAVMTNLLFTSLQDVGRDYADPGMDATTNVETVNNSTSRVENGKE